MAELHDTLIGKKLIEYTLPTIAKQLEKIANAIDVKDIEIIKLKERYKTLSELNADPKSTHRLSRKVREEMDKTLDKLENLK